MPAPAAATSRPRGFPLLNTATWNSLDVGYKRRDDGGYFEFQGASPWFFRVDGNQVTQSGSKMGAASQGMSPGNGYIDWRSRRSTRRRTRRVEGGYSSKKLHVAMSWMTSKFDNDNESVALDQRVLEQRDGQDVPRGRQQVLALRCQRDPARAAARLDARRALHPGRAGKQLGGRPDGAGHRRRRALRHAGLPAAHRGRTTRTYNGKVENETFTLALASTPTKGLDTRLYYNDFKRDDKSTHMAFSSAPVTAAATAAVTAYANEPYSYDKKNWGSTRSTASTGPTASARATTTSRWSARTSASTSARRRTRPGSSEWKTSMVESVNARLKYTNLEPLVGLQARQ